MVDKLRTWRDGLSHEEKLAIVKLARRVRMKKLQDLLIACADGNLPTIIHLVEECGVDPCFNYNEPYYAGRLWKEVNEYLVSKGANSEMAYEYHHCFSNLWDRYDPEPLSIYSSRELVDTMQKEITAELYEETMDKLLKVVKEALGELE